ncbi:hypothetical protein D3C71_1930160 [compost metagenome]
MWIAGCATRLLRISMSITIMTTIMMVDATADMTMGTITIIITTHTTMGTTIIMT